MKIIFLFVSVFIFSFANALEMRLEELITSDPIAAISEIEKQEDSDKKFAALYKADSIIASRCDYTFYYQGKINPKGFYGKNPGKIEEYVIKNKIRFNSASEGMYSVTANNYWIDKIKNKGHLVIGDKKYSEIHAFDLAVWGDGDGSDHINKLKADYTDWIKKFPKHNKIETAKKRILYFDSWLEKNKKKNSLNH